MHGSRRIFPTYLIAGLLWSAGATFGAEPKQIHALPTPELIECFKIEAQCGVEDLEIQQELVRRRVDRALIDAYRRSRDVVQQTQLVATLYELEGGSVVKFMRTLATEDTELSNYYALQYLGSRGDRRALEILNKNYFKYPVSSLQWSFTVALFGKYRFRPAVENLIESLNAASLNLAGAALESLQMIFPGSPPEFGSPIEAQRYFRARARKP
jgi:hypothetical protein